jgi:5-methylcytosine-specific restriction endonuclease McrA
MTQIFLTGEQLVELTGAKQARRQIQWLTDNGYHFDVGLDGRPKVYLRDLYARQLKREVPERPDYSGIDKPRERRAPVKRTSDTEGRGERRKYWLRENRALIAAHANKRRALRLNATPPWADLDAIAEFYREAARLTRETGTRHVVDHIIPLRGKSISGLHVETNLRVITESENLRKSNRFEP